VDPATVRYVGGHLGERVVEGDLLDRPHYVADGLLVQWVNARGHAALVPTAGHFEVFDGDLASYTPVRVRN
jgi:hypothetical protein